MCSSPSPAEEETATRVERAGPAQLLDVKLALKDQGVCSSKILSLRYVRGRDLDDRLIYIHRPRDVDHQERLPQTPVAVPLWVKFHQCWLSVVQGSLPCTAGEAVTVSVPLLSGLSMLSSVAGSNHVSTLRSRSLRTELCDWVLQVSDRTHH